MGKTHRKSDLQYQQQANSSKKQDRQTKQLLKKQHQRAIHQKNYQSQEEIEFANLLQGLGLTIRHVQGDGNCLFRSIADQLTGCNDQCHEYRNQIMNYIEQHKDHFVLFMEDDEDFDHYVERMRQSGEWGGHQELFAASQCLRLNIYVHQVNAPRFIINSELPATRDIHISYHGECHYNSVRLSSDIAIDVPALPIDLNASVGSPREIQGSNAGGKSASSTKTSSNSSAAAAVQQALPWMKLSDITWALEATDNDPESAIELLMTYPDGAKYFAELDARDVFKEGHASASPLPIENPSGKDVSSRPDVREPVEMKGTNASQDGNQSIDIVRNAKKHHKVSISRADAPELKSLSKKDKRLAKKALSKPMAAAADSRANSSGDFNIAQNTGAGGVLEITL